jgi:hypothetical protein
MGNCIERETSASVDEVATELLRKHSDGSGRPSEPPPPMPYEDDDDDEYDDGPPPEDAPPSAHAAMHTRTLTADMRRDMEVEVLKEFYADLGGPQWKERGGWDTEAAAAVAAMWALAAERFAAPPHSNGHDKRYETVKAEIRGLYGKVAINANTKARLKALAVARGVEGEGGAGGAGGAGLGSWHGVSSDADNESVTELSLARNNLAGDVSDGTFGQLCNLRVLDLHRNPKLTGVLATSDVGSLAFLTVLDLHFTAISGDLPGEIAELAGTLEELRLSNTDVGGALGEEEEGGGGGVCRVGALCRWVGGVKWGVSTGWGCG